MKIYQILILAVLCDNVVIYDNITLIELPDQNFYCHSLLTPGTWSCGHIAISASTICFKYSEADDDESSTVGLP